VVHQRLVAAKAYARHNGIDRVIGAEPGARLGIVCAGKTSFDVRQSLRDLGVDDLAAAGIRILKLGMTWPVVEETVVAFADSVQQLLVIEEKRPFVETQLRTILHEAGNSVPVLGKKQTGAPLVGELDSATIARIIGGVLPDLAPPPIAVATGRTHLPVVSLPARSPGFCSGCPHNRSTVFPEDALVGGGVGCHGIVYFEARHQGMKALPPTPMGAEGVPWIGLSPFVDEPHLIQNLGDGTLSHSGTLAIRASVAAGVNVTFKILYNAAVAMTGGQDVVGLMDVPAMTRALEAEGVRRIVVCSAEPDRYGRRARWAEGVEVLDRDQLDDAQRRLRQVEGVSVIIYDQQCAAEARRLRKKGLLATPPRRVVINEAVCEGCGDCSVKSNCLSVLPVDTEFGVKRQIHDPSCNRDYTCLEGDCPSFVTLKPARVFGRRPKQGDARPRLPSGELPTPTPAVIDGRFGVYFTGIGGTGVVTAARIIAEAADRAGLQVGGMDQTGLSQKAGAVVSHLHLAHDHESLGSPNVSSGGADLYLSGDILQAAGPMHLDKVKEGRAVGVVAHDLTPTTAMLQAGIEAPQAGDLEARIRERLASVAFVDSQRIAEHALGNHLLANVVLLGAAFQLGGLPLTLADLDGAIERQGKAAAANRAAFEWGRWAAHDPAAVAAVLGGSGERSIWDPADAAMVAARPLVERRDLPHELHDLLVRRTAQAIEYQGRKRAERFLGLVAEVARRDTAEQGWLLTRTVADVWFKLLTYKDEYDVARLHLKLDMDEVAREYGIDGRYKVTYHLHPPLLRRMGLEKKLPMGKPYEVAFHALRRMKGLRGTPLDVFGYDPDRRMERALIDEYERLVQEMAGEPYDQQVRIADSGHTIKGYGPIKERNVERWRAELAALRQA
jgi:indolepyruvate ferredoxin oxidoreductase